MNTTGRDKPGRGYREKRGLYSRMVIHGWAFVAYSVIGFNLLVFFVLSVLFGDIDTVIDARDRRNPMCCAGE